MFRRKPKKLPVIGSDDVSPFTNKEELKVVTKKPVFQALVEEDAEFMYDYNIRRTRCYYTKCAEQLSTFT